MLLSLHAQSNIHIDYIRAIAQSIISFVTPPFPPFLAEMAVLELLKERLLRLSSI